MQMTICVDANPLIGVGHAVRTLALAQAWMRSGGMAHFYGSISTSWIVDSINESGATFTYCSKGQEDLDFDHLCRQPNTILNSDKVNAYINSQWFIFDGYRYSNDLISHVYDLGAYTLVFDDAGERVNCRADVVLNQNCEEKYLPNFLQAQVVLCGKEYALLRDEITSSKAFVSNKSKHGKPKLLLTLGGGDNSELLTQTLLSVLRVVEECHISIEVLLVPGVSKVPEVNSIFMDIVQLENPHDIVNYYLQADMAVTSASSTCWELGYLGIPMLLLKTADNQSLVYKSLITDRLAKPFSESSFKEMLNLADIVQTSEKKTSFIDGMGADRVVLAMKNYQR